MVTIAHNNTISRANFIAMVKEDSGKEENVYKVTVGTTRAI